MENLFLRNYFYIDSDLQMRIHEAKVAFLGVGLGSSIAENFTRTGFNNFFLCDGDTIEYSNLNRQNFTQADIGKNKSFAITERLLSINPGLSCSFSTKKIDSMEQIESLLKPYDIIINTVDCGKLYFDIIENFRRQEKLVICPFNPGFGGLIVCFTKNSGSAYEFFETDVPLDDFEIARHLLNKPGISIAEQLNKTPEDYLKAVKLMGYFPQLAIGANLTSALATTSAIKFLNGDQIKESPNFYYVPSHLNAG